jgi:hypothetical protein
VRAWISGPCCDEHPATTTSLRAAYGAIEPFFRSCRPRAGGRGPEAREQGERRPKNAQWLDRSVAARNVLKSPN